MSRKARPSYEFGPFRLDLSEHMLLRDGHPLPLTPKVFDVLRVLVQNGGHLVEKDTLFVHTSPPRHCRVQGANLPLSCAPRAARAIGITDETPAAEECRVKEVWPDSFVEEGALNKSVSILRKALGEGASGLKYIETAPKLGYRFVAPVTEYPYDSSPPIEEPQSRSVVDIAPIPADSRSLGNPPPSRAARVDFARRASAIAGAVLIIGGLAYGDLAALALSRYLPRCSLQRRSMRHVATQSAREFHRVVGVDARVVLPTRHRHVR